MIDKLAQFIQEVNEKEFDPLYFCCSGGFDSTAKLMLLYDKFPGIKKYILFNYTYRNMKSCVKLVYKLSEITKIPLIELRPKIIKGKLVDKNDQPVIFTLKQSKYYDLKYPLVKDYIGQELTLKTLEEISFSLIPFAEWMVRNKTWYKSIFPCCKFLKEDPAKIYYDQIDREKSLILLGYNMDDGSHRQHILRELRDQNQFTTFVKTDRIYKGYPLRDFTMKEIEDYIQSLPFPVEHSGCKRCPILIIFKKYLFKQSPKRTLASQKYYLKLRGYYPCIGGGLQTTL